MIREIIKEAMKLYNIGPSTLADAVGISKSAMTAFFKGGYGLGLVKIESIFKVLGIEFIIDQSRINKRPISKRDTVWNDMFNSVKSYHDNTGTWPSSYNTDKAVKKLGLWCVYQRQKYKAGNLSQEKIDQLESIDFQWVMKLPNLWDTMFEAVKEHRTITGEWPDPNSHNAEVAKLGRWYHRQKHKLKQRQLTPEKKIQFIEIFSENNSSDLKRNKKWNTKFEDLKKYIKQYGALPSKYSQDTVISKLGEWCYIQLYKIKQGKLEPERIKKFAEIDIESLKASNKPNTKQAKIWDSMFEDLRRYTEQNGELPSQYSQDASVSKLGKWLENQKSVINGKRGKNIYPDRKAKLEAVIAIAENIDSKWTKTLDSVKAYFMTNGSWPSPHSKDAETARIGRWCNTQRQCLRLGKLSLERKVRLDEIKFQWGRGQSYSWDEMFNKLKKYLEETGKWPSAYSQDERTARLGKWSYNQRSMFKKGIGLKNNPDRKTKFDEIDISYKL